MILWKTTRSIATHSSLVAWRFNGQAVGLVKRSSNPHCSAFSNNLGKQYNLVDEHPPKLLVWYDSLRPKKIGQTDVQT